MNTWETEACWRVYTHAGSLVAMKREMGSEVSKALLAPSNTSALMKRTQEGSMGSKARKMNRVWIREGVNTYFEGKDMAAKS